MPRAIFLLWDYGSISGLCRAIPPHSNYPVSNQVAVYGAGLRLLELFRAEYALSKAVGNRAGIIILQAPASLPKQGEHMPFLQHMHTFPGCFFHFCHKALYRHSVQGFFYIIAVLDTIGTGGWGQIKQAPPGSHLYIFVLPIIGKPRLQSRFPSRGYYKCAPLHQKSLPGCGGRCPSPFHP